MPPMKSTRQIYSHFQAGNGRNHVFPESPEGETAEHHTFSNMSTPAYLASKDLKQGESKIIQTSCKTNHGRASETFFFTKQNE